MHMTVSQAAELLEQLTPSAKNDAVEVVFCPPFTDLHVALEKTKGTGIGVGAQNMHFAEKGAYTGEIAPGMLQELGVTHVILGHSERRAYFNETDEDINAKIKKAFDHKLTPIVCCGESLTQREQGVTMDFVRQQIKVALLGIPGKRVREMVIAYEPIWAIGTGKVATAEQAQEVCAGIRATIRALYDDAVADAVRIQYGGSVKGENAAELFAKPDIDGALVGGASLKEDFINIIQAAE